MQAEQASRCSGGKGATGDKIKLRSTLDWLSSLCLLDTYLGVVGKGVVPTTPQVLLKWEAKEQVAQSHEVSARQEGKHCLPGWPDNVTRSWLGLRVRNKISVPHFRAALSFLNPIDATFGKTPTNMVGTPLTSHYKNGTPACSEARGRRLFTVGVERCLMT